MLRVAAHNQPMSRCQDARSHSCWATNTSAAATTEALDECLDQLGVGYVDLMLIHWPGTTKQVATYPPPRRALLPFLLFTLTLRAHHSRFLLFPALL